MFFSPLTHRDKKEKLGIVDCREFFVGSNISRGILFICAQKEEWSKYSQGIIVVQKTFLMAPIALFLAVLLVNTLGQQSGTLSLIYAPTVMKEGQPFVITALLRNIGDVPMTYGVTMRVENNQVFDAMSRLDASATQSFTYTRASPVLGTSIRVCCEAVNLESGERYVQTILIPPSPPEVWMSFSAFSAFATSISSVSSSSTLSSSFTVTYYEKTVGMTAIEESESIFPKVNIGVTISVVLISLLIFHELTDPTYGGLGRRMTLLRVRYQPLILSLLMIFLGIVLTKIVTIIAG